MVGPRVGWVALCGMADLAVGNGCQIHIHPTRTLGVMLSVRQMWMIFMLYLFYYIYCIRSNVQ